MKYLTLFLFAILFSFTSCKKTETYIDTETMASIIIDSKKAEVLVQSAYSEVSDKENVLKQFNNDILEKYNVTIQTYNKSLEYYMNNPKQMSELVDCLKQKNAKLNVD